jgi:hypothetical protein
VESIDEVHARPPGASDALVAAAGAMSEAFERIERARGTLGRRHVFEAGLKQRRTHGRPGHEATPGDS